MRSMMGLFLIGVCFGSWALSAHAARVRMLTLTQTRDKADTGSSRHRQHRCHPAWYRGQNGMDGL